jgi:hypothetical protein
MKRTIWPAAVAIGVVVASLPGFAQDGGRGEGQRAGGLMSMGAFGGDGPGEIQRTAEVEVEGGQRLKGEIGLKPLTVQSDLGQYSIPLDRIKMIRFLKPPDEVQPANVEEVEAEPKVAQPRAVMRRGMPRVAPGFLQDPLNQGTLSSLTRGKLLTATGREIIGNIYLPTDFKIALDVGTLYLAAGKLRTITFTDAKTAEGRANEPALPEAIPASELAQAGRTDAAQVDGSTPFHHYGDLLFVSMPGSNRVAFYDIETRKSQAIELSASKDEPVEAKPLGGQNILALELNGSKITRIAVAEFSTGHWYAQDLRQPVKGPVSPILSPGVAVYTLGRYVYAFSAHAHRWDVLELPEGSQAKPEVGIDRVTIQGRGHIDLFPVKTGKWDHIDARAILDGTAVEKK